MLGKQAILLRHPHPYNQRLFLLQDRSNIPGPMQNPDDLHRLSCRIINQPVISKWPSGPEPHRKRRQVLTYATRRSIGRQKRTGTDNRLLNTVRGASVVTRDVTPKFRRDLLSLEVWTENCSSCGLFKHRRALLLVHLRPHLVAIDQLSPPSRRVAFLNLRPDHACVLRQHKPPARATTTRRVPQTRLWSGSAHAARLA
jgi:hypothetical protein